ncbi:uncharacterized protein LOC124364818 [Homalodisca vitripennis]|uniref:uncharacterized protein LOC124364818 n=1 Tax=Homalodisca vitripennis TaxID=197043 RepID=UPI001EEA2C32|nr:uncharacterized protein LOC124364818 [Homalodisca vitripennis]
MTQIGTPEIAKIIYHAFCETHIMYGIAAWGGTTKTNMNRILILQKRALRTILGLQPMESCREHFKILTVYAMYICEVAHYASIKQPAQGSALHNYNTRHATRFNLPAHRTSLYARKPIYAGMKILNHLPQDFRQETGATLKNRLKNLLLDNPIYSMDEFYQTTWT